MWREHGVGECVINSTSGSIYSPFEISEQQ